MGGGGGAGVLIGWWRGGPLTGSSGQEQAQDNKRQLEMGWVGLSVGTAGAVSLCHRPRHTSIRVCTSYSMSLDKTAKDGWEIEGLA